MRKPWDGAINAAALEGRWLSPGDDRAAGLTAANAHYVPATRHVAGELKAHGTAVAPQAWIAPRDDRAVGDGGEDARHADHMLHVAGEHRADGTSVATKVTTASGPDGATGSPTRQQAVS